MEQVKFVNQKLLRYGYTTGTCAAGAATAAAEMLLTGKRVESVRVDTPKGIPVDLEILEIQMGSECASCAVRKDGGDDPDATTGLLVFATVTKIPEGILIDGGEGVGRVTKPGLDQPVGNAAINHVPRQMITDGVEAVCRKAGYEGGLSIVISVPGGDEVARHTFNPNLGIQGGLSILGTTGIVEPMSDQALIDTTRVELNMLRARGSENLLLTIGNYGDNFAKETLGLDMTSRVKCSNFIGQTLGDAAALGFRSVFLVGHIGKMVKLGAGIMNTHSAQGDARMEILVSCALEAGADLALLRNISACATTDAAIDFLIPEKLLQPTMEILGKRIGAHLERRFGRCLKLGALVFTNFETHSQVLCTCGAAEEMLAFWREKHEF